MQMPSLEATENSLPCTFPKTGIYILLDADILLNFLRACDLQTRSFEDLDFIDCRLLGREGENELAGEVKAHTAGREGPFCARETRE